MSIVILGGHQRMERQYKELCEEYKCDAKIFTRADGGLKRKMGKPDLLIFFTSTMSHKMVRGAEREVKGSSTQIEYVTTSSASALRNVLRKHVCQEA